MNKLQLIKIQNCCDKITIEFCQILMIPNIWILVYTRQSIVIFSINNNINVRLFHKQNLCMTSEMLLLPFYHQSQHSDIQHSVLEET